MLISPAFYDTVVELKLKPGQSTILTRNEHEVKLSGILTSTHLNLDKLRGYGNQVLAKYFTEHARDEISEKKSFLLLSNRKI